MTNNDYLMDINRYSKFIDKLIINRDGFVFSNDSVEHAAVAFEKLIGQSKYEIRLYTSKLCDSFFMKGSVYSAFKKASDNNIKLSILVQASERECKDNKYNDISKKEYEEIFKDNFTIKYDINLETEEDGLLNNFLLIDSSGIRYEQEGTIEDCNNIDNVKAKCSIGADGAVKYFSDIFDEKR
ncbi:MAG: hypothetical protein DRG78_06910 [Epsilonproteobacteria bacterium]|nr:MAG: hypothetical protein DRG78_06910 [Campylobacterota bacterium]